MAAKKRKPGDWLTVVKSRRNKDLQLFNGQGLSNIPRVDEVGSAAYRRLLAKRK